jgi:hypothetical protein
MLFNNAGLMRRGDVTETGNEDVGLLAVNVEAPFRLSRGWRPTCWCRSPTACRGTGP